MKMKTSMTPDAQFSDLTAEELASFTGGGFAYDAGRALRFLFNCGCGPAGLATNIVDYVIYSTYE